MLSQNNETINVLVVVDGETLYNKVLDGSLLAGTVTIPTSLGTFGTSDVYISLITQNNNVSNNLPGGHEQGQAELSITCKVGDIVQWSVITFDANTNQTPYLYNAIFETVDPISREPNNLPLGITNPLTYKTTTVVNYFPPSGNPTTTPKKHTNTIATAAGTITIAGQTLQYAPCFALVNNSDGSIIGYFTWDPYIVTTPA
jgi:hypothetical protein